MTFRDGFKMALGAIGVLVAALSQAEVLPLVPRVARPYVLGAAAMLAAMGITQNVQKRRRRRRIARLARARERQRA